VLTADEARELLESIKLTKKVVRHGRESEEPGLVGLRDRALIGVMAYTFARVGAVLQMRVKDYFVQGRLAAGRINRRQQFGFCLSHD
jgi:integrase